MEVISEVPQNGDISAVHPHALLSKVPLKCVEWTISLICKNLQTAPEHITDEHREIITQFLADQTTNAPTKSKDAALFVFYGAVRINTNISSNMSTSKGAMMIDNHGILRTMTSLETTHNAHSFATTHYSSVSYDPSAYDTRLQLVLGYPNLINRHLLADTPTKDVVWFVRVDDITQLTSQNIENAIAWGISKDGNAVDSFLRLMQGVMTPTLLHNRDAWPDSIQKDFNSIMHKFMSSITENANRLKGRTILYVPMENPSAEWLEKAHCDKELVQLLESTVIHWTRLIREVIGGKDVSSSSENLGPLAEIEYWSQRAKDLSNICEQFIRIDVMQIVDVLRRAKSYYYLEPFLALKIDIEEGRKQALDNLKYLNILKEPCVKLSHARPKEIPPMLKEIVRTIQLILVYAKHYKLERFYSLLRMVGNEVINRCRQEINIQNILGGVKIEQSMVALQESASAGEAWIMTCTKMLLATDKRWRTVKAEQLDIDETVFKEVDAFAKHRCQNLMELCKGQLQFGFKVMRVGREDGTTKSERDEEYEEDEVMGILEDKDDKSNKEKVVASKFQGRLPIFGGAKGAKIEAQFLEIQHQFCQKMEFLRNLNYDILDVKCTRWSDDFRQVKSDLDNLSTSMAQVIQTCFDSVCTVQQGAELLESFFYLAKREELIATIIRRKEGVVTLFNDELKWIQVEMSKNYDKPPTFLTDYPPYSGRVLWMRSFLLCIQSDYEFLCPLAYFSDTLHQREVFTFFRKIEAQIEEASQKLYNEWLQSIKPNLDALLDVFLVKQEPQDNGVNLLRVNFPTEVHVLFEEIRQWQRMEFAITPELLTLASKEERLRIVRENIAAAVRAYNSIVTSLNVEDRNLFAQRIALLDSTYQSGLTRLWWSSQGVVEYFVWEGRAHAAKLQGTVNEFKVGMKYIAHLCNVIAETLVIDIEKVRPYELQEFEELQHVRRSVVHEKVQKIHEMIFEELMKLFGFFRADYHDEGIRVEWHRFVRNVERDLEDALKLQAKCSLMVIDRILPQDKKVKGKLETEEVQRQIFRLRIEAVSLEGETTTRIETTPSVTELKNVVTKICTSIRDVAKNISRFEDLLTSAINEETDEQLEARKAVKVNYVTHGAEIQGSYQEVLTHDPEKDNLVKRINNAFVDVQSNIENKIKMTPVPSEERESRLWASSKQFNRIKKSKECTSYKEYIDKVIRDRDDNDNLEALIDVQFIQLDYTPLKEKYHKQCEYVIDMCWRLLREECTEDVTSLIKLFDDNIKTIGATPQTRMELQAQRDAYKAAMEDIPRLEGLLEPINIKFNLLTVDTRNGPSLSKEWEDLLKKREKLSQYLDDYKENLAKCYKKLEEYNDQFKTDLEEHMRSFNSHCQQLRNDINDQCPQNASLTCEDAFAKLDFYRKQIEEREEELAKIHEGQDFFGMERITSTDLVAGRQKVELLTKMWELTDAWRKASQKWRVMPFKELNSDEMSGTVESSRKQCFTFRKELERVDVWIKLREEIELFKHVLPVIDELLIKVIRARHWAQLGDQLGIEEKFGPDNKDFNLELLLKLHIEKYAEFVVNLATAARQEAKIETDLQKIEETWRSISFQMEPHQKQYTKITGTDDLINVIAEHITILSSMKTSRFIESFKMKVQQWEQDLGIIGDTIEALLNVQGKWMYLENIFIGSEDIKRKLVNESKMFEIVHNQWLGTVAMIQREYLTISAVKKVSIEQLNGMASTLEQIQKGLEGFLEDRRRAFPRFYFLSNDDLLEILGHTKEPEKVQPHLKKCFEGLYQLSMKTLRNNKMIADAMSSADGEKVTFVQSVHIDGVPVEQWLSNVEQRMRDTLAKRLNETYDELRTQVYNPRRRCIREKYSAWICKNEGQCLITAASTHWTAEVERVISDYGNRGGGGRRKSSPVYKLYKKWKSLIKNYCTLVRECQDKFQRNKLVALITIEVHNRDILRRLQLARVSNLRDFEWSRQLRFYSEIDTNVSEGEAEKKICIIRQTSSSVKYDYEYLGNTGRLVVTDLTDRAYMTLTTALQLFRGGLPQGPAGTGKTETVKDLGKAIAKYVIVFNCSEGLDYKSLGRMFSGLAQTGGWSCFDEFNRIEVEVLSVVAQQISCILCAVARRDKRFLFEGVVIPLNLNCGIFVTMNPGYAGRSELPDNLKALLRPISMMVPDFALICEITLLSEGFEESNSLSKKVAILYELMEQQLSKQDHYDFSLRNIKAVLVQAGSLKRENFPGTEAQLCLKAMMDMNIPKFVKDDVPLFLSMLGDLFPGVQPEDAGLQCLIDSAREHLTEEGLEVNEHIVTKTIHLWDTLRTRHGVMVVGGTGAGKTVTWQTLSGALKILKEQERNPGLFEPVKVSVLNPKSVTMDELYGSYNQATREWKDGILSELMRNICRDTSDTNYKWLIFDGPVDTLWIESMNTVLDDNKMLTLNSGERISMNSTVSMLFEVQDLSQASPATVSRCGMVYFNVNDLGWMPFVKKWLRSRQQCEVAINAPKPEVTVKEIEDFVVTNIASMLEYKERECVELFPTTEMQLVRSFCSMFDSIANPDASIAVPGGVRYPTSQAGDNYIQHIRLAATFSLLWTFGGPLNEDSRRKFDVAIRGMDNSFPAAETSFEYFPDYRTHQWENWDTHEDLTKPFVVEDNTPYHNFIVPTLDTVRYEFLVTQLVKNRTHIVLVGNTGTGKSLLARIVTKKLTETHLTAQLNFSAQTTAANVQDIIEGKMEHKSKKFCSPPGGKKMICWIEDLNMPQKEKFGAQPPLELLRQWVDNGFWYDRHTRTKRQVNDMQLMCCMTFGRPSITLRFQSKLNLLNVTFPSESVIKKIFTTILCWRFEKFHDFFQSIDTLVKATIEVYNRVTHDLLPIPSKSHYLFNLRDLSKVFQGIFGASLELLQSKEHLYLLWVHECMRVFQDRMNDPDDNIWFRKLIEDKLGTLFQSKWSTLMKARSKDRTIIVREGESPIFVDFWDGEQYEMAKYRLVPSIDKLKEKVEQALDNFNSEPGYRGMNLVFFTDAVEHLCRIHRIIRQPRGNALLVGLGGSGRFSLTRLASYLAGYSIFTIEISKKYDVDRFHDDLRTLYRACGVKKQFRIFYFSDNQVVNVSFLEDLNNMLTTGEVPNLFAKDDLAQIRDEISREALSEGIIDTADEMYNFFIQRARENLHLVVAMSPAHKLFRLRLRQFPALVSCTCIDWFMTWPNEALKEVSMRFLDSTDFGEQEMDNNYIEVISEMFVFMHDTTSKRSIELRETLRRYNYVTPSSYLDLVRGYTTMLVEKREIIYKERDKLSNGMSKLEETKIAVGKMTVELKEQDARLQEKTIEVDKATARIQREQEMADQQQATLASEKVKIEREKKIAVAIMEEAEADLAKAQPMLDAAIAALDTIKKEDINEVKAYRTPPELVMRVLGAVQVCVGQKPDWKEAVKMIAEPKKFVDSLKAYKKDEMSDKLLTQIEKFVKMDDFKPEKAAAVSNAAGGLCQWVISIHAYGIVYKQVHPKQVKAENARNKVRLQEEQLRLKEERLAEVLERVRMLQEGLLANQAEKERLMKEAKETRERLKRAQIIVDGLEGERDRWTDSIAKFTLDISNLVGDVLLASGCLSYLGAFPSEFRHALFVSWMHEIRKLQIPHAKDFAFVKFLVDPTEVRDWEILGLPGDDFSKENAVVVTRGTRFPLMIDPQLQALKWIRKMEKDSFLKVVDQKQPDFLKTIETAVISGWPVLLQDVLEDIDPSLDPVISKAIIKKGGRTTIKLGDAEIDYNPNFRLYITTRMANPHYTPEVCTKVCLINFAVKEQGLEEQLLKIVIRREKPELEEEHENLILSTAAAKKGTKLLQDEILNLLNYSEVSILENHKLIETLQTSKVTAANIQTQLKEAEVTQAKITAARELFRPCAKRASILFFVLADLGAIDNMYQFALDSYITLFKNSIRRSAEKLSTISLEERIETLNNWHTDQVYNNTCRGLFEKHKLLFSFHMCMKILISNKEVNLPEYIFFMKGGQILDKQGRIPNPAPHWLLEKNWDNIIELDKLLNFHGIAVSFESIPNEWQQWFLEEKPEDVEFPSEWEQKTSGNQLQRMVIIRCLRPDRVIFLVYSFIMEKLGANPGVDPATQLASLALQEGRNLRSLALGQGQDEPAKHQIQESAQLGGWVFLANCHLMTSWLSELEKIIDILPDQRPHENFRLWLSSVPTPQFPIGILQKAIKMTTEPPSGIKSNMLLLYNSFSNEALLKAGGENVHIYRTLLFSLCFFHSILLERKKFGTLGYNVIYDFTYSDFEVSENIIKMYVENMEGGLESIPFVTLRYLIAEASYGGRVTDDWDRRIINTYMIHFMRPDSVLQDNYSLSEASEYFIPSSVATLAGYKKFCQDLPITDPPEAFGQHANADISSQIAKSNQLLEDLIALNATLARSGGGVRSDDSKEMSVEDNCLAILSSLDEPSKAATPSLIDYDSIYDATSGDRGSALNTCLLQEIQRYNVLLRKICRQKNELRRAVKGEIVMNEELEDIFNSLLIGRVPVSWTSAYPSVKSLASWSLDLVLRIDQMKLWGQRVPKVFWLAGFTYPTGFLKSLQQQQARRDHVAIDEYDWEFFVLPSDDKTIMNSAKEGAYVSGIYLEGAGWNPEGNYLEQPNPMELIVQMPMIHFKPKRRDGKPKGENTYICPLYMYPVRTGTRERPSFVVAVDLDTGNSAPEHWVLRGTALLLATDE